MSKSIQNIYEKMMKKQGFNEKVKIDQPNPYDKGPKNKSNINEMDENFINALDNKIAMKKEGLRNKMDGNDISNELIKLNEKIEDIMKIQMKIIGMING